MGFLRNSKLVFASFIALAFLFPDVAEALEPILISVLIAMMTMSLKDVAIYHVHRRDFPILIRLLALNFLILPIVYLVPAWLLIADPAHRAGIVLLAAMPPAVGIVSLTYLLRGNVRESIVAEFLGYFLSLALTPLMTLIFLGKAVSPLRILHVMALVVFLPLLLSRAVHYCERFIPWLRIDRSSEVINLCYGLSFFIIIGMNRETFLGNWSVLLPVLFVLIIAKFLFGTFLHVYLRSKTLRADNVVYVLFGTFKNGGAATALALLLYGVSATVPLAINAIIIPFYIIYLEWLLLDKVVAAKHIT